jgi:hypothetical protein
MRATGAADLWQLLQTPLWWVAGLLASIAAWLIAAVVKERHPWRHRYLVPIVVAGGLTFGTVIFAGAAIRTAGDGDDSGGGGGRAAGEPVPKPEAKFELALRPRTLTELAGRIYGVDEGGRLVGIGLEKGRWKSAGLVPSHRFRDSFALTACRGGLYVSYAAGRIARIEVGGHDLFSAALTRNERVFPNDALLACDGVRLYGAVDSLGGGTRVDVATLETTSNWIPLGPRVDRLAAAWGWLFAADLTAPSVHFVDVEAMVDGQPVKIETAKRVEASNLLPLDGRLWALGPAGCLTPVDIIDPQHADPPTPVAAGQNHLVGRSGEVLVVGGGGGGGSLTSVPSNASSGQPAFQSLVDDSEAAIIVKQRLVVRDQQGRVHLFRLEDFKHLKPQGRWPARTSCRRSPPTRSIRYVAPQSMIP